MGGLGLRGPMLHLPLPMYSYAELASATVAICKVHLFLTGRSREQSWKVKFPAAALVTPPTSDGGDETPWSEGGNTLHDSFDGVGFIRLRS